MIENELIKYAIEGTVKKSWKGHFKGYRTPRNPEEAEETRNGALKRLQALKEYHLDKVKDIELAVLELESFQWQDIDTPEFETCMGTRSLRRVA